MGGSGQAAHVGGGGIPTRMQSWNSRFTEGDSLSNDAWNDDIGDDPRSSSFNSAEVKLDPRVIAITKIGGGKAVYYILINRVLSFVFNYSS